MATNNIKIFDQNKANMLTDEAYNTSTQRLNGVQQGIASSQLQNKTLYQVSLVAYSIGQMMQANGLDANDANAVSTFAGNLSNTIVQKILDKASTTEAKNFTVNNKFITPQTWKAAYDFMKADSDMVTSAVDDTHYITPKLLKEGAEKYGDKVRLDDEEGTLTQWKTFDKKVVSKFNIDVRKYINVSTESSSVYTTFLMPDKLKRYVICQVRYNDSNFPLLLFDYKTGELLDSKLSFTYNGDTYTMYHFGTSYNNYESQGMISAFSENCFLITCLNTTQSSKNSCLVVDFSTGKFVVKNAYIGIGSYTNIYLDRTRYFNDIIYHLIYSGNEYGQKLLKYDISKNLFTVIDIGSRRANALLCGLNENINFYILLREYNSNHWYAYIVDNDSVTEIDLITDYTAGVAFCSKNNFIYAYISGYGLVKINVTTKTMEAPTTTYGSISNYGIILINDNATGFYYGGTKYGTFDEPLEINETVSSFLGSTKINVYNYSTNATVALASDNAISANHNVMKYLNEIVCSDTEYVYDIEYAYFGAPVTEITEST